MTHFSAGRVTRRTTLKLAAVALVAASVPLAASAQAAQAAPAAAVPSAIFLVTDPPPAPTTTLALDSSGPGTASASPAQAGYAQDTVVALTPAPAAGALFIGWRVDGLPRGWAMPLRLAMDRDHAVTALFAPRPRYPDVGPASPHAGAIEQLAARQVIKGYADGTFGPDNPVQRAQGAALLVRALGWSDESAENPFTDRGGIDAELWRAVAILARRGVAHGYGNGRYGPSDPVLRAQVISLVARALVEQGCWQRQADDGTLYPNVPASSGHRRDLATFVAYAGPVSGERDPGGSFAAWNEPASRGWFAAILWQALDSYFGR